MLQVYCKQSLRMIKDIFRRGSVLFLFMGSRGPQAALTEQHLKALALIEKGGLSVKEVADAVGFSHQHLYDLYECNDKTGELGKLFKTELQKIYKKREDRLAELLKDNKKLAMELINEELYRIKKQSWLNKHDRAYLNSVSKALASLSPSGPKSQTVSFHQHYTGLTPQEMLHEFNRFRGITEGALDGGRVSRARKRGAGEIPLADGAGGQVEEEPEDSGV